MPQKYFDFVSRASTTIAGLSESCQGIAIFIGIPENYRTCKLTTDFKTIQLPGKFIDFIDFLVINSENHFELSFRITANHYATLFLVFISL